MHPIQIAFFGLFLLLLEMSILVFADTVMIVGVLSWMFSDDMVFGFKMFAWGGVSLLLALVIGFIGKLLCFACPEEGARKLIVLAVVCEVTAGIMRWLFVTGQLDFPFITFVIAGIGYSSYIFFLQFLTRMGDNVGEPKVGRFVAIIYGLFGFGFILLLVIIFSPKTGLLLLGLEILVNLALYTYTIYTLFRAMPLYIEEVKAGITDPTESGEDRKEAERKERMHGPGGGGPSQSKPPEEPKGTPPEGHKLYRIPKGLEPLHMAAKEGDRYKVELRLAQGDDPNATVRHGLTALHIAASVGVMDVADCLLGAGVPIDVTCERGITPVYFAIQTGNPNIVGYFLNKGANLFHKNEDGNTPLHWACSAPHPNYIGPVRKKMVNLLISQGADLGATNNEGKTPRDMAMENQLEETIAEIDRHLHVAPKPVTSIPSVKSEEDDEPVEERSYNFEPFRGVHLGTLPSNLTPMHQAVKDGEPEKVQTQIARGGTVHDVMAGGMKPIHITGVTGVMSVTELLLKYGVPIDDTCDHHLTAMFFAVLLNNYNMVGYLVSRGANINHQDEIGRTPLHWAAGVETDRLVGQNRTKLVKFMLQNGADPAIRDNGGLTALDLALGMDHEEIVKLLEEPEETPNEEAEGDSGGDDEDEYYV